jgi:hypothetical protein
MPRGAGFLNTGAAEPDEPDAMHRRRPDGGWIGRIVPLVTRSRSLSGPTAGGNAALERLNKGKQFWGFPGPTPLLLV